MDCPYFSVSEYGVFDSHVKFPKMLITEPRPVEEYELELYTADCPGSSWIDGNWHALKHGAFICAKPGQMRKSRLPFKCHYIHLQTQDASLCQLLNALPGYFLLWDLREPMQIFQEMLSVESSELPEDRLLLESCICRLIRLLSKYRAKPGDLTHSTIAHQKAMLSVEQYIREHLAEPLSLEVMAAVCNLSPGYFHGLFTDFFGKSPAHFVLDCRINAAKTALIAENYTLSEVAKTSGFSSTSYFCSKFKQVTGKTPIAYRREMLGRLKL